MTLDGILTVTYVVLWVIVIIQTFVLFELLRQIGILRRRMPPEPGALLTDDGLERGAVAPAFHGMDILTGQYVDAAQRRERKSLLAFLSPTCAGCHAFAPDLSRFAQDYGDIVDIVTICPGTSEDCASFARTYRLGTPVISDLDQSISKAYHVHRTPSATLIDPSGRVLIHGIPNSLSHLEGLLEEEGTPMPNPPTVIQDEKEVRPLIPQ